MEMADLNAVLGEVVAAESGYEREIDTDLQAGEIQVRMHPLSIKRAVANMVVNAARYGNGWIKVSSGSELNRAWFQVEDDGPGIKPEQRKHLFQPFVRGDSARSTSGTGLGLAIVQRIIDNHNGLLEIGTSERGGLSIRAWLPVPVTRGQLRSRAHQRSTRRGIGILLEVLDKQLRQRFRLLAPLLRRTRQESRAEAGGEGWGWLRHAALGTRQLGGEAGEEVRIATDRVEDIRLGLFRQANGLRVAAAFKVEYAVVIPAVLVIANQATFWIGGQGGFPGAGQAEEYRHLFVGWPNEHVFHEMRLPGHFGDKTYGETGIGVSAAESVDNEQTLAGKLLGDEPFQGFSEVVNRDGAHRFTHLDKTLTNGKRCDFSHSAGGLSQESLFGWGKCSEKVKGW
ncbi:hypothetical protein L1887_43352 [Cichorium endivia]|nr:hypothetical protein L1887_43352 [Cichorium endivia]